MRIRYNYDKKMIKYIKKEKNKLDFSFKHIRLTKTENLIFNELYHKEIVKIEDFNYLMESQTFRLAIFRLRKKIEDIYTIKNKYGEGYILVEKNK